MKREIRYIELKSWFGDNGPAWIGRVDYSKSGQTIFFNGMALKKLKTPGISGNHFDIETGEEYWVSGIKKNGQDRCSSGGGKIMIDEEIIKEYLEQVEWNSVEKRYFEIMTINKEIDKTWFEKIENDKGDIPIPQVGEYYKWYWDYNRRKLVKE